MQDKGPFDEAHRNICSTSKEALQRGETCMKSEHASGLTLFPNAAPLILAQRKKEIKETRRRVYHTAHSRINNGLASLKTLKTCRPGSKSAIHSGNVLLTGQGRFPRDQRA